MRFFHRATHDWIPAMPVKKLDHGAVAEKGEISRCRSGFSGRKKSNPV